LEQYDFDLREVLATIERKSLQDCPLCPASSMWEVLPKLVMLPWYEPGEDVVSANGYRAVALRCGNCGHLELLAIEDHWLDNVTIIEPSAWRDRQLGGA